MSELCTVYKQPREVNENMHFSLMHLKKKVHFLFNSKLSKYV